MKCEKRDLNRLFNGDNYYTPSFYFIFTSFVTTRTQPEHKPEQAQNTKPSNPHKPREVEVLSNFSQLQLNKKTEKCGGWDSNPRTPARQGPKPCSFDLAWRPPLSNLFRLESRLSAFNILLTVGTWFSVFCWLQG
jgi:hypothetical protein